MTIGFDLGHDLDLEFSRSNMEFPISQPKVVRLPRNEKQTYRLNSRPQMWPMVWIYQIVTGVTSVVGVPSTHLVWYKNFKIHCNCQLFLKFSSFSIMCQLLMSFTKAINGQYFSQLLANRFSEALLAILLLFLILDECKVWHLLQC